MEKPARYRLIACSVFQRELCAGMALTRNLVDPEFLEISLHERPEILRNAVQARIDAVSAIAQPAGQAGAEAGDAESGQPSSRGTVPYEAILLAYGLCGNGLAGIQARDLPLVLPRAHDCCTVLLGSRKEFLERFSENLSAPWTSVGYYERGTSGFRVSDVSGTGHGIGQSYDDLVAEYGEDNARYLWETLNPYQVDNTIRYIELAETSGLGYGRALRERAGAEGREYVEFAGSSRLLRGLLDGGWDSEEYLVIPPGCRLDPTYDHVEVFKAV